MDTPAPPQPHPAGPGSLVGLGSSLVSGPCWLKLSPSESVYMFVYVCMCVCLSGSLWSVGLQHVSDTGSGVEKGRKGRGWWPWVGVVRDQRGKVGKDVEGSGGWTIIPRAIKGSSWPWSETHLMKGCNWVAPQEKQTASHKCLSSSTNTPRWNTDLGHTQLCTCRNERKCTTLAAYLPVRIKGGDSVI